MSEHSPAEDLPRQYDKNPLAHNIGMHLVDHVSISAVLPDGFNVRRTVPIDRQQLIERSCDTSPLCVDSPEPVLWGQQAR